MAYKAHDTFNLIELLGLPHLQYYTQASVCHGLALCNVFPSVLMAATLVARPQEEDSMYDKIPRTQ